MTKTNLAKTLKKATWLVTLLSFLYLISIFIPTKAMAFGAANTKVYPASAYHTYDEDIRLIAHRGYAKNAPENTLASIDAAGKAKYWGCEFDVRRTADGEWILMHDESLLRTTGTNAFVNQATYAELQNLDCGISDDGSYIKIPTLKEALLLCKSYNMAPFIEVKSVDNPIAYAAEIYAIIKDAGLESKSTVISFNQPFAANMKAHAPKLSVALLTKNLTPSQIDFALKSQIGLDIRYNVTENELPLLQEAASKKLLTSCYTINNAETLYDLFVLGLRTFTTDSVLPEHTFIMNTSIEMPALPIFRFLLTENYRKTQ